VFVLVLLAVSPALIFVVIALASSHQFWKRFILAIFCSKLIPMLAADSGNLHVNIWSGSGCCCNILHHQSDLYCLPSKSFYSSAFSYMMYPPKTNLNGHQCFSTVGFVLVKKCSLHTSRHGGAILRTTHLVFTSRKESLHQNNGILFGWHAMWLVRVVITFTWRGDISRVVVKRAGRWLWHYITVEKPNLDWRPVSGIWVFCYFGW